MAKGWLCLSLVVGLALAGYALLQPSAAAGQDDDRVAQLITQLGNSKYAEREKAQRDLEVLGMPALEQLRKAVNDADLEISRRSQELLKKLEDKLAAAILLAPKKVKLSFKDTPVTEAIQELQKQSGYKIIVQEDHVSLATRMVTLETGEVTFWEAFDKVCQAGGLREEVRLEANPIDNRSSSIQRVLQQQQKLVLVPPPIQPPQQKLVPVPKQAPLPVPQPLPLPVPKAQVMGKALNLMFAKGNVGPLTTNPPGVIVVRDSTPATVPTSYHGAVRMRLLPASQTTAAAVQPRQEREALFLLEVTPEPRLQQFSVISQPRIDKATDDQGQTLAMVMEPTVADLNAWQIAEIVRLFDQPVFGLAPHHATLRLKLGEKQAKSLKELTGTLTVRAQSPTPDALITVADVMKAAGQTAKGQGDGSIFVQNIEKQVDGAYRVQIRFQGPQHLFPANNAMVDLQLRLGNAQAIQGTMNVSPSDGTALPVLVDANGKALALEQIPQMSSMIANGQLTQLVTMVFRAGAGIGEPAQMVLFGHRLVTARVPFRFEGVPLP